MKNSQVPFTDLLCCISRRHLLFPRGAGIVSPFCPTDATLRHWVCFPKPHRAKAAIQGKPSLRWHSFEHASHTTSHGLLQKNVDFSHSLCSSLAGLDLLGRGPFMLFMLYNSLFSPIICSSRHFSVFDAALCLKKKKLNEEFYSTPLRIYIGTKTIA